MHLFNCIKKSGRWNILWSNYVFDMLLIYYLIGIFDCSPKLAACAANLSSSYPDSALTFGAICHLITSALACWPVYGWTPGLFHSLLDSVQATSSLALGPKETCSLLCLLVCWMFCLLRCIKEIIIIIDSLIVRYWAGPLYHEPFYSYKWTNFKAAPRCLIIKTIGCSCK